LCIRDSKESPAGDATTSDTVFANPLSGVMMIMVMPVLPSSRLMELELVEILKSGMLVRVTATTTLIVWESDLLVPIIVTV